MTNKEQYRTICANRKLPLFMNDWWLDVVSPAWDVAITYNGTHLSGVWPYCMERKAGVNICRTPTLTPYLGPYVFYPDDLKESKRDNFEHEVTTALLSSMPAAQVWNIALRPAQQQVGLYKAQGFDIQPRQTFLIGLDAEEPAIFANLHEDYRRNIRKTDVELSIADEPAMLAELWAYQKATLDNKDVHMHFSMQQLQRLFDACKEHNAVALWVARKDDIAQAMVLHVWDDECAYYLTGANNPTVKNSRAMTALLWKAISESKKMGKKVFDFEGSMDQGVEKFFRNFGGKRTLYLTLKKNNSLLWKLKELLR